MTDCLHESETWKARKALHDIEAREPATSISAILLGLAVSLLLWCVIIWVFVR